MKQLLLFCTALCLSILVHAQTPKYDATNTKAPIVPDKLKVSLTEGKLYIVYKNQEIPSANILVLDSLLKKVPGKEQLMVEFENLNAEPEKVRTIDAVLKQCQCPVSKKSTKIQMQ